MKTEKMKTYNARLAGLILGRTVKKIEHRRKMKELFIEFSDGTRLFVDHNQDSLELSVTNRQPDEDINSPMTQSQGSKCQTRNTRKGKTA
jgi:hypothetical protein